MRAEWSASSAFARKVIWPCRMITGSGTLAQGQTLQAEVAGNSPVSSPGCKPSLPVAEGAAGNPSCRTFGRILYFRYSSQG